MHSCPCCTPLGNLEPSFLCRIFCCLTNTLSPIWTTSTWCVCQIAWVRSSSIWCGHFPPACHQMQEAAARADPQARVWRGEGPPAQQGVRVLGIPIGHEEFVQPTTEKHKTLVERIPSVQDLQSTWLLSSSAPTPMPRTPFAESPPAETQHTRCCHVAVSHDSWASLVGHRRSMIGPVCHSRLGGCGLRSATRTRVPAHWASWADGLRMIHVRHPEVALW